MLAKFRDLGCDHRLTIRLTRVGSEVALVIILRPIEFLQRCHLGHDGAVPNLLGVKVRDQSFCDLLLLRRLIKNRGTILGAHIMPLSIERRGIVNDEEDLQDFAIADDLRVSFS